jgi:hypothetical protein
MLTKLAGVLLVGSLGFLAVSGVTGLDDRWQEHQVRNRVRERVQHQVRDQVRSQVRVHREHVREAREEVREAREEIRGHTPANNESVQGTYAFKVDGSLFGKFDWAANVELDLQADGRYELRVKTEADGETDTETSWGRYRLNGDRVRLYSANDGDAHDLTLNGDRLEFNAGFKEAIALRAVGVDDAAFTKVVR